MQETATSRLANRAEMEKAIRSYWCVCVAEEMARFLTRNQVEVKKSWKGPELRDAIREFLRTRTDRQLAFIADETRPVWSEVPEPIWSEAAPAQAEVGKAPLIIVRQAPTGGVSASLWVSGVEGADNEGELQFEPDDFAGIRRGPTATEELRELVRGWLAKHPNARLESEVSLELDSDAPPAIPDSQSPIPVADDANEPFTMPGLGAGGGTLTRLRPDEIRVVGNPRKHFDEAKLQELADSIRAYGILEPLVVNRVHSHHDLVAGERRLRAAKLAGLPLVPCVVLQVTSKEAAELRLLENLQRQDLTPLEEANAFAELIQDHGYTQEQLATKLGKSQGWVSERLALRELPEVVRTAVVNGDLAIRTALALRPYLPQPGQKVPEAVLQVAKEMAEYKPPASEAAEWVRRALWQTSRSLQEADVSYYLRNGYGENFPPRDRVFPLDQTIEGTGAPICSECPMRTELRMSLGSPAPVCLQPSCWGAKQATVWRRLVREHKAAQESQQRERHERLKAQTERAIENQAQAAGTSTAPVDELADAAIRLRDLGRRWAEEYGKTKDKLRAEMEKLAGRLGFAGPEELELALAGGHGRLNPGTLQPPELARRITDLLARKAAGEDITQPVAATEQTSGATAAPPLEDADAELAKALQELAKEHWPFHQTARDIEYDREAFLPIDSLLQHWQARAGIGASHMPVQLGPSVHVHIPEFAVWIRGHGYQDTEALGLSLQIRDGQLHVSCSGGHTVQALPDGMVYYRVRVAGSSSPRALQQMLVMRCPGDPVRHLVVTGESSVTIRKDLVPRWQKLMSALPAVPTRGGDEHAPEKP